MGILAIVLMIAAWIGSAAVMWFSGALLLAIMEICIIVVGLFIVSFTYCTHCPLHTKDCKEQTG